jgi:hypothetical protein
MANTIALVTTLRPTVAPNLPIGPVEYSQQFMDQYSNVLRLYFNQIDNFATGLVSGDAESNGGRYLRFPHVSATDDSNLYAVSNTATVVEFNTLETVSGFTLNANSTATCTYTGVYKIDYSLQFANNDNAAHDVDVWLKVNNQNVPDSTTRFTIPARKSAGVSSYVCGYSHVTFQVNASDVVGLYWATNKAATANGSATGIFIEAFPASASPYDRPSIPSTIGTIQFVSGITT